MAPSCPANYFGKGRNYSLPDDPVIVREFMRAFEEYELAHPDDPTGENLLIAWEEICEPAQAVRQSERVPAIVNTATKEKEEIQQPSAQSYAQIESVETPDNTTILKLTIGIDRWAKLKRYAAYRRCRPRDIISVWIDELPNLPVLEPNKKIT